MDTLGTHASNLFWQFLKKNFFFSNSCTSNLRQFVLKSFRIIAFFCNNHQVYQIDNNFNKQFYTSRFRLKNNVHSLKQTLCLRLMCKSSSKSFISISNMLYTVFFLNSCHAIHMNYRYKLMIFKDPKNFPKSSNCKRRQGLVTKK